MRETVVVNIDKNGRTSTVTFKSPCLSRVECIADITSEVIGHIEKTKPQRLVFDFNQVKFFSSQVLGLLLQARERLNALNGQVVLGGINPRLFRVFRITHLDRVFSFLPEPSTLQDDPRKPQSECDM